MLDPSWASLALPLGISFYTFQQIAYLVDVYRGETFERGFTSYALFVCFFPQLIAGPIVHHREMLPQFKRSDIGTVRWERFAIGLTILSVGLFKKVVLADGLAPLANTLFDTAAAGTSLRFFEAWMAATTYGLQLYFDFSGYSDMAVGIAYMFGIKLPINFLSPYKAAGFIEFWRCWHRTLSRFLKDYIYVPLGGNRRGQTRRYVNLMITMLLGGLWHGAGWTFLLWGGLHGLYLALEHGWRHLRTSFAIPLHIPRPVAVCLTFTAVMFAWVPFRAADLSVTLAIWRSMLGGNGLSIGAMKEAVYGVFLALTFRFDNFYSQVAPSNLLVWCGLGCLIVFFLPNIYDVLGWEKAQEPHEASGRVRWRPRLRWALAAAFLLFVVLLRPHATTDFLYYQF